MKLYTVIALYPSDEVIMDTYEAKNVADAADMFWLDHRAPSRKLECKMVAIVKGRLRDELASETSLEGLVSHEDWNNRPRKKLCPVKIKPARKYKNDRIKRSRIIRKVANKRVTLREESSHDQNV